MMRWLKSFITGSERPNHLETRVQAAKRNVDRAQRELSLTIQEDSANVRKAFANLLDVETIKK